MFHYQDTFSQARNGFDNPFWWAKSVSAGGIVDENYTPPPSWLGSPYPRCLRTQNPAGDGASIGPAYAITAIISPANNEYLETKIGMAGENLADNQASFAFAIYNNPITVVLMDGYWLQQPGGQVYLLVRNYAAGGAGANFSNGAIVANVGVPYKLRLRVDIDADLYGFSLNDGAEVTVPVTDGGHLNVLPGLMSIGNTSYASPTIQPVEQLCAYVRKGWLGANFASVTGHGPYLTVRR